MRPDPELHQLAIATAAALGGQWHLDTNRPDEHLGEHITHPDGRAVRIDRTRIPGRLAIVALYPPNGISPDACRITVRADRGPHACAAEIIRRVLPRYASELTRVRAYLAAVARYDAFRRAVVSRLTAIPGTAQHYDGTEVSWTGGSAQARVYFTPLCGGTINLQLSHIPDAAAVEIIARLATMDLDPGAARAPSPATVPAPARPATAVPGSAAKDAR